MSPNDNEQQLLQLVSQWRDDECQRLLDRAWDEGLELLRKARRRGRRHLHEAVQAERERNRGRIAAAEAELQTLRRQHEQQLGSVILAAARRRLPERLAEHWADQQMRSAWIRSAARQALLRLPRGRWSIRHAFCFQAADFDTLLQALKPSLAEEPELISDMDMDAGLIIESNGVRLDASAHGLLADTEAVNARLLALVENTGDR